MSARTAHRYTCTNRERRKPTLHIASGNHSVQLAPPARVISWFRLHPGRGACRVSGAQTNSTRYHPTGSAFHLGSAEPRHTHGIWTTHSKSQLLEQAAALV